MIAGAYVGSAELVQKITGLHIHLGASLDPHACFLLQRGMQTLPLRVKAQAANALALATFLEQQPQVRFRTYCIYDAGLCGDRCSCGTVRPFRCVSQPRLPLYWP